MYFLLAGLFYWIPCLQEGDTVKRRIRESFSASISVQSDDATQIFRTFDLDLKYEWKTEIRQLEVADEFGVSLYHGGVANRYRDRFVLRFSAQANGKKTTGSTSFLLEGPLFPKQELLFDPSRGRYLSDPKGGFLNPSQLVQGSGIRFLLFDGAALDLSFPALMLNRIHDLNTGPNPFQRKLLMGSSSVLYYSAGATAIFQLSKYLSKSFYIDCRSRLFLNGYRFKYQQWDQELRIAWQMRKSIEWVLQARFSEDRTIAPKVMKWYSLRLGYRLESVK